jgi:hypothetical protein
MTEGDFAGTRFTVEAFEFRWIAPLDDSPGGNAQLGHLGG